jgi:hypothetical protein
MAVLVSDSFNRANSTTTLGTTDSYNGGTTKTWSSATTYGISSNQAQKQTGSATSASAAWIDGGVSDGKATITLSTLGNHSRLIFRRTADSDCYWLYANGTTNYQLYKRQAGVNTVLATIAVIPTNGDVISATFNGSSITVQVNGANDSTVTNTFNQTATQVGFVTDDSVARLDNFNLEDLSTGTTYTDGSTTFDTKQSIYQDNSTNFDTKQTIYNDSFISSDTKQTLYSDSSVPFDTKQGIYSDSQVLFNTKQVYYNDGSTNFDTLQVIEKIDWVDGSVSFDTQQLITETPKVVAQEVNLTFIAENEVNLSSEMENSVSLSFTI